MVSRVIDSGDQEERPAQSDVALQTTDAHETELEKAQRMLRMVCRCNQVLFRTTNKIELLNEICASAVKEGGYLMAWIGLAGPHDKSLVHPVAWYNVDKKYRESIIVRVAQSNQGKGPMGATLQTKAPTIAQNILNNPALESLHESASLMGYSSFVILPLTSKDRVIGLFKIYSAASNSFGQDELDSLVEIASDLSFGIEVIRTRKEVERVHASVMEEKQKADQYLNIAGVMLCVLDTTGKITTINDHGCALLEVSRSEAIGQNWFDNFLPQGQITPVKEVFRKLMAGEVSSVEYHENTIVTSHGAVKMVAFHNAVLTDKGGQITGILFSGEDISKRREIEVLRSQYRHIVDSSADMMALLSKEFTYLAVNRRYLDYLGKNYDDMVGKRVDEVLGEQYFNDVIRPAGLECMEGTDVTARSWHHVHSNGAIYMEVHYYPYYGADNEILGFAINGRDITSQFLLEEELKRRLEEIQTVLQSLPDLYFRLDLDGTLLEYGTPDESLLFAKPEFFIGKSILDVMPIAVAELFKNSLQSFSEGKNYASFDYEFPTPSGRSYFEARLRLMSNNQVILLVRDNSAQRSAEGETQRTWTELQHILDSANAVVIGVDNAGRVTEWNATVATLTGYSKKFALGKSCFEHFIAGAPEDKQGLQSMFKEIFNNTQSSITFKCFLRTKNKGDRLIYFGGTPRNDVEGNIIGLIGIGQDITELVAYQSNMEQKVLDRTRELHAIMTLSPDGYLLVDDNSEIIFVNRAFTEMTGLTIIKLTGLSLKEFGKLFYALCDPDEEKLTCAVDGTDAKCVCEDMFSCTNAIYTVVKMIRPAKRTISVSIKMNDEKNPGSKSKVLFFRDITHETEVDQMKSDFLSNAAHELRTPLASILGYSELLLMDDSDEEKRFDFISTIHRQSYNLKRLLDELLDLARIEARVGKDFNITPGTLEQVVKDAHAEMSMMLEGRALRLEQPETWPQIAFDPDKMHQVLINVIGNAIKYSTQGDITISSTTRVRDDRAEFGIVVEDAGIGMSPEELTHIGERFYRADKTGEVPGTGLGLAVVKEIIALHHGAFEIVSEKGKKTTATIWLTII